jgi:hypothetical protein
MGQKCQSLGGAKPFRCQCGHRHAYCINGNRSKP